jgi:hypothetical protein
MEVRLFEFFPNDPCQQHVHVETQSYDSNGGEDKPHCGILVLRECRNRTGKDAVGEMILVDGWEVRGGTLDGLNIVVVREVVAWHLEGFVCWQFGGGEGGGREREREREKREREKREREKENMIAHDCSKSKNSVGDSSE